MSYYAALKDRSQCDGTGVNAHLRLKGATMRISYQPMWSRRCELSSYTYEAYFIQLSPFQVPGTPRQHPIPEQTPGTS